MPIRSMFCKQEKEKADARQTSRLVGMAADRRRPAGAGALMLVWLWLGFMGVLLVTWWMERDR
jgi:hypothetical protein